MKESTNMLRQQPCRTAVLTNEIKDMLTSSGIKSTQRDLESFAAQLVERERGRPASQIQEMGILHFIKEAQVGREKDEALWRAFLATHFGEVESAGRFLCALGQRPTWTWLCVSAERSTFVDQLYASEAELKTLRFGNHRKYCSPQPHAIAKVINSFVQWVGCQGGSPSAAFALQQESTPERGFRELYLRFDVHGFGRLGRFDLLKLLGDMELLNIQPDSCYLVGSTGPLAGARKMCGASVNKFSAEELSKIIDNLARRLEISYSIMEDALCIWQKKSESGRQDCLPISPIHCS